MQEFEVRGIKVIVSDEIEKFLPGVNIKEEITNAILELGSKNIATQTIEGLSDVADSMINKASDLSKSIRDNQYWEKAEKNIDSVVKNVPNILDTFFKKIR